MSTNIALGAPVPGAVARAASEWESLRPVWTGYNGASYDLSNVAGGVVLLPGVRGLSAPPFERHLTTAPGVAGSRHRGRSTLERPVFLPLFIYTDQGSAAWLEHYRAFKRTLHPDRPGVLSITAPGGEVRHLTCRFVDDSDHSFEADPVFRGWVRMGIRLVAEDPFWNGDPIMRSWTASEPVDFFGTTGGPPFYISSSSTLAGATMPNPGDEESPVVWVATGPTTTLEVGVGSDLVDVPFAVADGDTLVIDAHPEVLTAWTVTGTPPAGLSAAGLLAWVADNEAAGTDRTGDLGAETAWAAIPAGNAAELSLSMAGTGVVRAIVTPRYHEAF